jgi:pimeloyl-ACP methyl ester carboxylesterase
MRHINSAGLLAILGCICALALPGRGDDAGQLLTIDHYVAVRSTAPSIAGQPAQLYVRERLRAGTVLRGTSLADHVVLFVHGAGSPAEVAFDVPYKDYSWMAYLAAAGFDVFAMDVTGYGRSTRPAVMNDPCNLSPSQQAAFVPSLIPAPCASSYPHPATTIASDWNDIGAVVDYVRALRRIERLNLVGWSRGGPQAGGYAAQHPEKVQRLVLLATAYTQASASSAPEVPLEGAAMDTQSRQEMTAVWDGQVGCPEQFDSAARETVLSELIQSDPVGVTWGPGVRRAPQGGPSWDWNAAVAGKLQVPTLMVSGEKDKQVPQDRVRELYADLGARQKVFIDLACSSHYAMWEKNHMQLFRASLEWLTQGSVDGKQQAMLRLGYPSTEAPH